MMLFRQLRTNAKAEINEVKYNRLKEFLSNLKGGSVAFEVFTKGISYYGEESSQQIWKSDWFEVKDDEPDYKFYEFCLFVPSFNYMISVIWEK